MKSEQTHRDPAFSVMAMDILGNVLSRADSPSNVGEYVVEEMRELTGAACILLVQCMGSADGPSHRVVNVNPMRRHEWALSPVAMRMYGLAHDLPGAALVSPEESSEMGRTLGQGGFGLSMVVPLHLGNLRVGVLLILGLPDERHIESVLSMLRSLSTVVALVLRNAFLFERQEQIIRRRTDELRNVNEQLQMELGERMRIEAELRCVNEELDRRVNERTAELERKNFELERTNKLFVGRELRMIELKEKIKKLEQGR